jgi:hypothetical protein
MDELSGYIPGEFEDANGRVIRRLSLRPHLDPHGQHNFVHAFDNPEQSFTVLPGTFRTQKVVTLPKSGPVRTETSTWYETSGAADERPDAWDWYAYSALVDAEVELGLWARARSRVEWARSHLARDSSPGLQYGYAAMLAAYVSKAGRWEEAAAFAMPLLDLERGSPNPVSCADQRPPFDVFARILTHALLAEAALRAGDPGGAEGHAHDIEAEVDETRPWAEGLRLATPRLRSMAYVAEVRARGATSGGASARRPRLLPHGARTVGRGPVGRRKTEGGAGAVRAGPGAPAVSQRFTLGGGAGRGGRRRSCRSGGALRVACGAVAGR